MNKEQQAIKLIDEIFNDTKTMTAQECLDTLRNIRDELELKIEALEADLGE